MAGAEPGLEVRVRSVVHAPHHRGPECAEHAGELELAAIERGAEAGRIGGRELVGHPRELVIIPAGEPHHTRTSELGCAFLNVRIGAEALRGVAHEMGLRALDWRPSVLGFDPALQRSFEALREEVSSASRAAPGQALLLDSLGLALGVRLLRALGGQPAVRVARAPDRLRAVEDFMRADLGAPRSLAELSAVARMSPFHFVRTFKQRYGKSPYAYFLGLRLAQAQVLLQRADLPITDVALELGFGSSSRFSEAFRRAHGVTPSAYRHAVLAQDSRSECARSG